jgi:hypothetical protein
MALPSKMSAARRIDERGMPEQPAGLQSASRSAAKRNAAHAAGGVARQAGDDGRRGLDRAEARTALDERFSEHLDAIVNATLGLSREQREIDRREAGAWRRFLWSLSGRRW